VGPSPKPPTVAAPLLVVAYYPSHAITAPSVDDHEVLERGGFQVHHDKRSIRRETCEIAREGEPVVLPDAARADCDPSSTRVPWIGDLQAT
jgi:hypothetical protein